MNRPNILWICSDQQRWDTIGALANPYVHTPNLDRLCAEGAAFNKAFCQSPICTPSRPSFLTGYYPSTVRGCRNNNDEWVESVDLISKALRDGALYDYGLVGKLHLAGAYQCVVTGSKEEGNRIFAPESRPKDDGYRVFHWSHSPYDDWDYKHAYREWVGEKGVSLAGLLAAGNPIPAEFHQTTFCADKAMDFIMEKRDRPWLMSVNTFDPHSPYDPPNSYLGRFDVASIPEPYFRDSDLKARAAIDGQSGWDEQQWPPDKVRARELRAAYYAMIELIDHNQCRAINSDSTGNWAEGKYTRDFHVGPWRYAGGSWSMAKGLSFL